MRRAFSSVTENPAFEDGVGAAADAAARHAALHQARGAPLGSGAAGFPATAL